MLERAIIIEYEHDMAADDLSRDTTGNNDVKLRAKLDDTVAFFYWLQVVAQWDKSYAHNEKLLDYYQQTITTENESVLNAIRAILHQQASPYGLLAQLYSGNAQSHDAQKIIKISEPLRSQFEFLWNENQALLAQWQHYINQFSCHNVEYTLRRLAIFLGLSEDNVRDVKIFLLPPSLRPLGAAGHTIRNTDFILLRPPRDLGKATKQGTMVTIFHEYTHLLAHASQSFADSAKASYQTNIVPRKIRPPAGYNWRAVYNELFAYTVASRTIGGLLGLELLGDAHPSFDELEVSFNKLRAKGHPSPNQYINWASLHMVPILRQYLQDKRLIDRELFDAVIGLTVDEEVY